MSILFNDSLYIFGGLNIDYTLDSKGLFNDYIFCYDLINKKNKKIIPSRGFPPSQRINYSLTSFKNLVFFHGGSDSHSFLNDLYIYNISMNEWILPVVLLYFEIERKWKHP